MVLAMFLHGPPMKVSIVRSCVVKLAQLAGSNALAMSCLHYSMDPEADERPVP